MSHFSSIPSLISSLEKYLISFAFPHIQYHTTRRRLFSSAASHGGLLHEYYDPSNWWAPLNSSSPCCEGDDFDATTADSDFIARDDDTQPQLYTYDQIVLGCITVVLIIYILLQMMRILTYRHKKISFHSITLIYCLLWMLCRLCFFLFPTLDSEPIYCFLGFMNWLPVSLGFATFSLLLMYFAWCFSGKKSWDKLIHCVPGCNCFPSASRRSVHDEIQDTLNQTRLGSSDSFMNHGARYYQSGNTEAGRIVQSKKNPKTSSLTNSLLQNDLYINSYQNGPSGFFTSPSKRNTAVDDGASLSLLDERKTLGFRRNRWFMLKKKHLCLLSYLFVNFVWTAIILGMSVLNCVMVYNFDLYEFTVNIHLIKIFRILVACSFCILVLFLAVYGIRLAIRIKNDDIPMSLKLSNMTVTSVIIVIVLNFFIFTSRVVIDILPLIPGLKLNLNTNILRSTDVGRLFLISVYILWEIMPILSVLFFFGKPVPSTSAKFQLRKKRATVAHRSRLQAQEDDRTHPLDVDNTIGEFAAGSLSNTPGSLIFGSQSRYQHLFDNPRRYDSFSEGDEEAFRSVEEHLRMPSRRMNTSTNSVDEEADPPFSPSR